MIIVIVTWLDNFNNEVTISKTKAKIMKPIIFFRCANSLDTLSPPVGYRYLYLFITFMRLCMLVHIFA